MLEKFLKNIRRAFGFLCLAVVSMYIYGQDSVVLKPMDHHYFDRDLIPAQSIYGNSWDSLHVDSPIFDPNKMEYGYGLSLVEEDCEYVHPFKGKVTSGFGYRWGRMHKGIDVDLVTGDPVLAAFDGVVRISKYNYGGFGHYVMIRHYNGLETIYGHLSKRLVECNQTVRAGEIIGLGGSTGRSTGSHLHFETRFKGKAFDPTKIIDFQNFSLKTESIVIDKTWFPYITNSYSYERKFAKYYRIRKGDTLSAIARRNGTTVTALCRLNRINRNSILRIGRTIRVR